MTPLAVAATAALWTAAAYRVTLAVTRPAPWRTALSIATLGLAAGATAHFLAAAIDEALGIYSFAGLLTRLPLLAGIAAASVYLHDLRGRLTAAARHRIIAGAAITTVCTAAAWAAAPIHDHEVLEFGTAAPNPATWIYVVGIYAYGAAFLVELTRYAHTSRRDQLSMDPPARIALTLIEAAGVSGILSLVLFAANVTNGQLRGQPNPTLNAVAVALFPVPLTLLAAGLVLLPLAQQLDHRRTARALARRIEPLWRAIIRQHPDVHLPLNRWRTSPRLIAHRRLIEIVDALEKHRVDPAIGTIDELAAAITQPSGPPDMRTAKDALVLLDPAPWPAPIERLSDAITPAQDPHMTTDDHDDLARLAAANTAPAARHLAAVLTPGNVVAGITLYISLQYSPTPLLGCLWAFGALLLLVAAPYAILFRAIRAGAVDDRQVVRRSQRPQLIAAATISVALAVVLMHVLDAPRELRALVLAMLGGLVCMGVVSLVWKASFHTAVAAGALAVLSIESRAGLFLAAVVLPALTWARWRDGRHTLPQLVGGALIGALAAATIYGTRL